MCGPSSSEQCRLVDLSQVSPFRCLLCLHLLGQRCLLFPPVNSYLCSCPIRSAALLPVASATQVPLGLSAVSLAGSASLDPFPGHLKGRKSAEAGETEAFKAGLGSGVFAAPREWKPLQRDLLPFCSGRRRCGLCVPV